MVEPPPGRCWAVTKPVLEKLVDDNRVWFGEEGNNVPRQKLFLSEAKDGLTPHTLWTAAEVGTNDSARKALIHSFDGVDVFDTPKPVELIGRMLDIATNPNDLVLDFFAGAGVTAEAVLAANLADGGRRAFILVQIPEQVATGEYRTLAEVTKERIRRAGRTLRGEGGQLTAPDLDTGFRVLKIDTSNMKDVYYAPDDLKQLDLLGHLDNIRQDRTPEDLLFQVLVDWGIDLALPIATESVCGKNVFFVDGNALAACFDSDISEDLVKALAHRNLLRAVFRDNSYGSDSVKINVE